MPSRLDRTAAESLRSRMPDATGPQSPRLVLDLSEVQSVGACAVPLLVAARRRTAARGAGLVVRRPSPAARRFLASTHLDLVLPLDGQADEEGARPTGGPVAPLGHDAPARLRGRASRAARGGRTGGSGRASAAS